MKSLYERLDGIVGKVSKQFPDATLMILSDHGFTSYRRTVNLNTWLSEEGFARPRNAGVLLSLGIGDCGMRRRPRGAGALYTVP